ncbi:hypothetical protein BN2127_JRS3_03838 [Bacillus safensis]|uniref:hypothetical protein n=1 Tax=Bacillus safensis TaxID=561879 RepID=UPI0006A915BB|nr:hypothetical protein [Bacillus safensis]CUB24549.1 hypothetical protein BN2127_JRS3_03838 [Bacillus safensis]
MTIQYFRDSEGKKGSIGTQVNEISCAGSVIAKTLTVDRIISKGRAGVRLYFIEGGYAGSKVVKIIEK